MAAVSDYIVSRDPNRFGGNQEIYEKTVQALVTRTAIRFRECVARSEDSTKLFYETLAEFGKIRHAMENEKEIKIKDAEKFGMRRDLDPFSGITAITPLSRPYVEFGNRMLKYMAPHLRSMVKDLRSYKTTKLTVKAEPFCGRANTMEFSILTFENRQDWTLVPTYELYEKLHTFCNLPIEKERPTGWLHELKNNRTAMIRLKERSPEEYKKLKLAIAMLECYQRLNKGGRKVCDWVVATNRMEINGKMVALSQYIVGVFRDGKVDVVDRMLQESEVVVLHQDPFLIEMMLADISQIFKRLLEGDDKSTKANENLMALFEYEFAHAMPCQRGSAAISEWFEASLYGAKYLSLKYQPDAMVNTAALALLGKQFTDEYTSMISLTKLNHDKDAEKATVAA